MNYRILMLIHLFMTVPIFSGDSYSLVTGLLCQSLKPQHKVDYLPHVPLEQLVSVQSAYSKILKAFPDHRLSLSMCDTFFDFAFTIYSSNPLLFELDSILHDFGKLKKVIISDYDELSSTIQTRVYSIDLKDSYLQNGQFIHLPTLKSECEKFAGNDAFFDYRMSSSGFPVTIDEFDDGRLLFTFDKGNGICFCVIYDRLTKEIIESRNGRVSPSHLLSLDSVGLEF